MTLQCRHQRNSPLGKFKSLLDQPILRNICRILLVAAHYPVWTVICDILAVLLRHLGFGRCLAVFESSILMGIITLKSALETATRHFSQLLIRVIPKKCRQMSSSNFLTFQMATKASYGIIFLANLLTLHYDSLSRNNLKV